MDTNVFSEILASYEISSNNKRKSSATAHWRGFFQDDYSKNLTEKKIKNFKNNSLSDGLDNRRYGNLTDLNNKFEQFIIFLGESGLKFEDIKYLFPPINTGNLQIILKNNNVKYFLIDLPEANLLSNYFLSEQFPEKRIFNLQKKNVIEQSLLIDDLSDFDIFILPTNSNISKEIKFNFINNTASMMEMNYKEISNYFALIQSNLKINGYFANLNRYYKDTANEKIYFHKYPYDVVGKFAILNTMVKDHIF